MELEMVTAFTYMSQVPLKVCFSVVMTMEAGF